MTRSPIGYLPRDLSDALRFELRDQLRAALGSDGMWKLERFMERAFAAGYDQGYTRAYQAGLMDGRAAKPGEFEAHLLAVLRAVDAAVEVTPEQLGQPGRVSVTNLTGGNTEFRAVST